MSALPSCSRRWRATSRALSAVDRALLTQACLLLARSERVMQIKDADAAIRMSGEARRLLESLRKHAAPPKVPSLEEHLAAAELAAAGAARQEPDT